MQTESILLQNLCVPCSCHCRYCLLSWNGEPVGVPWEQGREFAMGFRDWTRRHQPERKYSLPYMV